MDSFELNKIIGAVLGTLLFVMGVGFIAEAIYEPIETVGLGLELPEAEATGHGGGETVIVALADIGTLLAASDSATGEGQARKCQSCHSFQEGGPNGQGPNLWGIVERPVASHEGFNYSDAMKAHAAEFPTWTYAELNAFILAPKEHIPGTKMNFGGVKNDEERANIIAYLSTLSASPVAFPAPAAPAGEDAAAAEGATPAAEGAEPTPAEAAPVEPATETQSETPVQGTATGSNTPAGAETPAAGGDVPATTPAPAPTATIEPAPAPSGTITPASPPPATTTSQ